MLFTGQLCIGQLIRCGFASPVVWNGHMDPCWKPHCQTGLLQLYRYKSHSFYILPVIPQIPSLQPRDKVRKLTGPKWATFDWLLGMLGPRIRHSTSATCPIVAFLRDSLCSLQFHSKKLSYPLTPGYVVPLSWAEKVIHLCTHCTYFPTHPLWCTQANQALPPSQTQSSSLEVFPHCHEMFLHQSTPHINSCEKVFM